MNTNGDRIDGLRRSQGERQSMPAERPFSDSASEPVCVVGIGASAGGLEALERLFHNMPLESGMAFVVVQHLSPDYRSLMDELLARKTKLPIHRVENEMLIEAGHVYLMPANSEMILSEGRLLLTEKDRNEELSLPIDRFFRSLAQDAQSQAVAIVLSGSGSDGSRGIQEVHDAGGLVIAQDVGSATFDGMPQRAQDTGCVDLTLVPEDIPDALVSHCRRLGCDTERVSPDVGSDSSDGVLQVINLLRETYGLDFADYKPGTVLRRIERRLLLNRSVDMDGYIEELQQNPAELDTLYHDLLIGVTRFFRDAEVFRYLERELLPELIKNRDNEPLRIWVPGCASGEEAYSLAMLLAEQMEDAGRSMPVKIFATDVHRASLGAASGGVYSEQLLTNLTPERVRRHLVKKADGYHIAKSLRQMIIFADHNIVRDAPFTKLDLISCRNLLIYLKHSAQKKVLSLFHFGLKGDGLLLLGPSENPGVIGDEFDSINDRLRVYRKRRGARIPGLLHQSNWKAGKLTVPVSPRSVSTSVDRNLVAAYDHLLDHHMPPALLISDRRELVHTFGGAGRYLSRPDGRSSADVLDCLDGSLRTAVSSAFSKAERDHTPVSISGLLPDIPEQKPHNVSIEPIFDREHRAAYWLITFEPVDQQPESRPTSVAEFNSDSVHLEHLQGLEEELCYTKETLQATIEELEAGNEEQQATNEELVASNEELQSTNEELHSVNEELYTVNSEHQRKIDELTEITDDLDNLLRSTDIGTIFLDREMRIRKFTPRAAESFNLLPQDVGRHIDNLSHSIRYEGLVHQIARVLKTESNFETEVHDRANRWFLLRILPYKHETSVEGVVLTLVDISSLKLVETELRSREKEARDAVMQRDRFLAILSHELRNPLGAIKNANYVLERQKNASEELVASQQVIGRQTRQMARLLDDLLEVSRVTQRKIDLHEQVFDVVTAARDAVDAVMPLFSDSEVTLHTEFPEHPVYMFGDGARIQQIHVNLLANAAKYTPATGEAWLRCNRQADEIVISVSDTGVGIPDCLIDSIFDLFVQSDHSLDRADGGMGVGLTLVKSIVELHGGSVSARSDGLGRGSEFTIRFPCLPPDKGIPKDSPPLLESISLKIGVVEDNVDSRVMLQKLLEMDGHEVFARGDGESGIEMIQEVRPQIALVDIGLPGLSGYEVVSRLRENPANDGTKLVALTGYGRPADRQKALDSGFDAHLVKPLDMQVLSQLTQDLVRSETRETPEDSGITGDR